MVRAVERATLGHRFKSYNNFREYFVRGDAVVKELNFSWPEPQLGEPEDG